MTPSKEEIEALEEAMIYEPKFYYAFDPRRNEEETIATQHSITRGVAAMAYLQLITGKNPDLVVVEREKDEV